MIECSFTTYSELEVRKIIMKPIPIILDTDIGTDIDDMWALAMLMGRPELDPKLILTCCGDTEYRANLTAKFLATAGRTDIPVGLGISDPASEEFNFKFQEPWLSDFDPIQYEGKIINDGIGYFVDLIKGSEESIAIISIGAATNIAEALELEPSIAEKCRFVGMHGSFDIGYGGRPGAVAETNVRLDVPAFRKIISAKWQEITITPLDTCGLVILEGERYKSLFQCNQPGIAALLENYKIFSELVTWMDVDYFDEHSTTLFDAVAVYLVYGRDLLDIKPMSINVDNEGFTFQDPNGCTVNVAYKWRNLDGFYDHLLESLLNI